MKYLENYIIALLLITIIIAGSTSNASAKNDYLNEYGARCGDDANSHWDSMKDTYKKKKP